MLPGTAAIGSLGVGQMGARQPSRVADAAVVMAMPENGPVVAGVLFNRSAVAALRPGAILVDMSAIEPAEALGHTPGAASRRGLAYTPFTQATADLLRGPSSHFGDPDRSGPFTELECRNPPPRGT